MGIGCVLMILAAVFIVIKAADIRELSGMLEEIGMGVLLTMLPLLVGAMGCFLATMNDITAPSISLEAKTLWLMKSLPVDTRQIFQAKQNLHLLLTLIPSLLLHAACCIAFQMPLRESIESGALVVVFVFFYSVVGLVVNLKMPNLNWTNEAIAVKQSGSVMLTLFGSWVVLIGLGALYALLLIKYISPQVFLYILIGIFLILTVALNAWLNTRGKKVFEAL